MSEALVSFEPGRTEPHLTSCANRDPARKLDRDPRRAQRRYGSGLSAAGLAGAAGAAGASRASRENSAG